MMDYLKNYGITDDDIKYMEHLFENAGSVLNTLKYEPERVTRILNLFTSIGVNNIYGLLIERPTMICGSEKIIAKKIGAYEDKEELARLLNEDSFNLSLIGL